MSTGAGRRASVVGLLVAGATGVAIGLATYATNAFDRLELDSVDTRFAIRGAESAPADIVVVEIDDVTFNELQERWPFPRSLHGRLIDRLRAAGAEQIAYDVQFTEPTSPREDNALIRAVARAGDVILATTEVNERGESNVFGGEQVLRRIGARAGDTRFDPDPGGVWRRYPYEIDRLESFAVAAVETRTGRQVDPDRFGEDGAWIDYHGPPGTFRTVSFSRVLRGAVPPSTFRDATVVVGPSAPSLQDVHPTPIDEGKLMSGAEIQANAISTVDRGLPLESAPWPLDAGLIVALGLVAPAAAIRLRPLLAFGVALAAAAAYLAAAQLAFDGGTVLAVVYPLVALGVAMVGSLGVHYALAALGRRQARDMFARFVPEQVVDEVLARSGEDLRLGGVRRDCTVLFSDLRGFTTFCEGRTPDQIIDVLNRYLSEMSDAIMDHGGTLVAYMGDGIMAVFGAPLEQPDHADRAVAAAREMLGPRRERFNAWLREQGLGSGFRMGVGLNTGPVMSGQVGSTRRVEYTAIGDVTNTAARVEGMTKGTPFQLFVSESTRAELTAQGDGLVFAGEFEIRGREGKLRVWGLKE
ncbi:MAG: CHASE2 domain-containing protein [Solirubrobacterales bacterium]